MVGLQAGRLDRRGRVFLGAGLVAAAFFALLSLQVASRTGLAAIDAPLAAWAVATTNGGTWLAHLAAVGGSNRLLLPLALVAGGWMWRKGRRLDALFVVMLLVTTQALVHGLKLALALPRPEVAWLDSFGHSYPSGHTANGALLGALVAWYGGASHRTAAPVAGAAWALLVGWGRMLAGVHYLTDVLGGLAIGAALACTTLPLLATIPPAEGARDEGARRLGIGRRVRVREAAEEEPVVVVRRPRPPPPPSPA